MIGSSKSVWGFDPRTIPGCQLWLDAADSNTITGTTSVTAWRDKSTNGYVANSFVNSVPNPSWVPNIRNGNGVIQYSAGNGSSIANFVLAQTMSIFMIYYPINQSAGNPFLEHGPNANNESGFYLFSGGGQNFAINSGSTYPGVNYGNTTVSNTWQMIEGINPDPANSNTMSYYANGTTMASGLTQSGTTTLTKTLYINGRGGANNVSYNTYLAELIIYNIGLTTSQRQQVEGYLAHKWGLVPYYDSSIPLTIPGCQLWLDAADSSTITLSSSKVTQWNDKSGNGYNFTQATSGNQPTYSSASLNSLNTITFTSANSTYLLGTASTNFIGTNSLSVYGVFKTNNNTSSSAVFSKSLYGSAAGRILYGFREPGTPGTIVGGIGSSGANAYTAISDTYTGGSWRVFGFVSDRSGWTNTTYQNGTSIGSTTITSDTTTNLTNAFPMLVGAYNNSTGGANPPQAGYYLDGGVGELLVFNSALTTTQRQTIEGYLAKKWGIGASTIPSTHPFYSIRPHLRTFQPTDVPGCLLWLDGADQGSMTLSGSSVTQWMDKSGRGFNVATSSGATAPVYNSSTKELQFVSGNSNSFTIPQAFGDALVGTTFSFFFIGRRTVNTTYVYFLSGATSGGNQNLFIGFLSNKMEIGEYGPYASADIPTFNSPDPMRLYYYDIQSSTTANLIMNGNPLSTTVSGNLFLTSFAQPELGRRYGGAVYHDFNLSEMVVFSPALSTSQRQQVEGYLAHKWGLTPTYASNTPLTIPGCQLWLDGSDSTTITFTSGSNVNQWSDKSGNGRNATVYNGTPTYTVSSGMTFNGSSTLQVSYPASPAVETLFVIIKFNSVSSQSDIFAGTSTGQREFLMYSPYSPGTMYLGRYGSAPSGSINGGTVTTGTTYMLEYIFNGTGNTISFYQSGTVTSSGAPQFTYGAGGTITLIGSYGGGGFLQGQIYEILVYNTALTTSQRQQVEGYLARKWGISISATLPSPHPFKSFPPASLYFEPFKKYSALFNTVNRTALSIPSSSAFTLGTNNHTIEFWFYQTSRGLYDPIFNYDDTAPFMSTSNYYFNMGSNQFMVILGNGSGEFLILNGGTLVTLNAWHHYALVRNGSTFTLYIDGTSRGTLSSSISIGSPTGKMVIGSFASNGVDYGYIGYISNFRFVNGTAVYTSNFTPSTSPLTAIPNTQILLQGLTDRSPNAFTVTNNGGVTLSTLSPFPPP